MHEYILGGIEMLQRSMHTSVVLPAPCTPLRPTKNGVGSSPFEAKDSRCLVILSRMKGTQCSDLSSMISGILFSGALEWCMIACVYRKARLPTYTCSYSCQTTGISATGDSQSKHRCLDSPRACILVHVQALAQGWRLGSGGCSRVRVTCPG